MRRRTFQDDEVADILLKEKIDANLELLEAVRSPSPPAWVMRAIAGVRS